MKNRLFMSMILMLITTALAAQAEPVTEQVAPGVWRMRFGTPDEFTPVAIRAVPPRGADSYATLTPVAEPPFALRDVKFRTTSMRTIVRIPFEPGNEVYGFGIDPDCYRQKGMTKRPQVCDASDGDAKNKRGPGSSHAPSPLYFSTSGYGVYVDTARVAEFQVARLKYRADAPATKAEGQDSTDSMLTLEGLYDRKTSGADVVVDIPGAKGVDIYIFAGPDLRTAVQRYILFSGGGALPPMWGCGVQMRMLNGADEAWVKRVVTAAREKGIPCDMLGLEPKWQTRAYPCSFVWSPERFPEPERFIADVKAMGFKLDLWEHPFIHIEAPFREAITPHTADVLSMNGLVHDPMHPESVRIYQGYHEKELIAKGVDAFKIDECDRVTMRRGGGFSFPNITEFPSGIDGEQMGQTFGYLLQKNMIASFRKVNRRTFCSVRASGPMAAPLPFVLYSDTYELPDYVRQGCNASFSGFLWSPEVRDAKNLSQFQRRLAVATFANMFRLNSYYNKLAIWENYKVPYGTPNPVPLPEPEQRQAETVLRHFGQWRMRFLPYIYSAYCPYNQTGMPPVRALVLDFPKDSNVRAIDDQFMFGPSILVAPFLFDHKEGRDVYLPKGSDWYDMATGELHKGGSTVTVKVTPNSQLIENVPLFVRANSLIPIAEPVAFVAPDTVFQVSVHAFGDKPEPCVLFEDDGVSFDYEKGKQARVVLSVDKGTLNIKRQGDFNQQRYQVSPTIGAGQIKMVAP